MAKDKTENKKIKKSIAKSKALKESKGGESASTLQTSSALPLELQQKCLTIFHDVTSPGKGDEALLQAVKAYLFERDFVQAFGRNDFLRVYASRWSPSRALGYAQIFSDIHEHILAGSSESATKSLKALCIGGGAGAEVVALGAWMHQQLSVIAAGSEQSPSLSAEFVDMAAWDTIVQDLHYGVVSPRQLSKYASAAAKEANVPLVPGQNYGFAFEQADILHLEESRLAELCKGTNLVTLMFTLNELYSTSMPDTQRMLALLTAHLQPGALLLVVDSPGSYSTVSINGTEKKYPMQWLLDYTLLGTRQDDREEKAPKWQKVVSDDSRWFRLPLGLKYPIELENMRYQIHLYRRLDAESGD